MRDLLARINVDMLNLKLTFSNFISKPKWLIYAISNERVFTYSQYWNKIFCIAWNIRKQVMDERFRYNAHQPIRNMVIVFIITIVDHLITRSLYNVIYFKTDNEPSRLCRIVLTEL